MTCNVIGRRRDVDNVCETLPAWLVRFIRLRGEEMADDLDVEDLLEAPFKKDVEKVS